MFRIRPLISALQLHRKHVFEHTCFSRKTNLNKNIYKKLRFRWKVNLFQNSIIKTQKKYVKLISSDHKFQIKNHLGPISYLKMYYIYEKIGKILPSTKTSDDINKNVTVKSELEINRNILQNITKLSYGKMYNRTTLKIIFFQYKYRILITKNTIFF